MQINELKVICKIIYYSGIYNIILFFFSFCFFPCVFFTLFENEYSTKLKSFKPLIDFYASFTRARALYFQAFQNF